MFSSVTARRTSSGNHGDIGSERRSSRKSSQGGGIVPQQSGEYFRGRIIDRGLVTRSTKCRGDIGNAGPHQPSMGFDKQLPRSRVTAHQPLDQQSIIAVHRGGCVRSESVNSRQNKTRINEFMPALANDQVCMENSAREIVIREIQDDISQN